METSRPVLRRRSAAGPAALLAVFVLSACSGGQALPPGPGPASADAARTVAPDARHRAKARFVIVVPRKRKHGRTPAYISQGTKSLSLAVTLARTGASVLNVSVNLTASSPNCTTFPNSLQCTVAYALANGNYVATIKTFDGLSGTGKLLSAAQKVAFSVAATTTELDFTLDGIPHALSLAPGSYAVLGTQASGFTLYGGTAAPLDVTATDADGYHIVGAGSPIYKATVTAGTGWSAAPSGSGSIAVTPPISNGAVATLEVDATFADATVCAQTGAVCSTTASVTNHLQRLFVADGDTSTAQSGYVTVYDPPYTGTPLTITSGTSMPQVVLLDASQNLFVGQCDATCGHSSPDRVDVYAPPYTGAPTASITNNVSEMLGMAMDSSQNLFVSYLNANAVGVYAPPYTGTPTLITGLSKPDGLLVTPTGSLFVSNSNLPLVGEYVPAYPSTPAATITNGVDNANSFVMDAADNLYVSNANGTVTVYAPPYTGAPVQTIGTSYPAGMLAFDKAEDLFVTTPGANAVYVFAPPYDGVPTIVSTNVYFPLAIAVDDVGNLFVANSSNNSVAEFAPPYTGTPTMIRSGMKVPQSLALTP